MRSPFKLIFDANSCTQHRLFYWVSCRIFQKFAWGQFTHDMSELYLLKSVFMAQGVSKFSMIQLCQVEESKYWIKVFIMVSFQLKNPLLRKFLQNLLYIHFVIDFIMLNVKMFHPSSCSIYLQY